MRRLLFCGKITGKDYRSKNMKEKEIERKFLISAFPEGLEELEHAQVEQGYLCLEPEVRIRHKHTADGDRYVLCIKGKGQLMRTEVETELDVDQYAALKEMLDRRMITKDFHTYRLPGGLVLECSHVNKGYPEEFMYAEVEFDSVEAANAYTPEPFLLEELTYSSKYRMSGIWRSIGSDKDK